MERTLQIILALTATAAAAGAQGASPTPQAADTSSLILAQAPAPEPVRAPAAAGADPSRTSSVAANITAGMPGYSPPAPTPKPGTPATDLRDVDKPRNQIIRLPAEVMNKYVVRERRLPVFRVLDMYTQAGLVDLSFKEHPGLRVGNVFNLNSGAAYEKIVNEQLFAARQDMVDTAHAMMMGGDASEGEAVQQAIEDESFEASTGQGGPVGIARPITRE